MNTGALAVNEVYATIQGEGRWTGTPAVFIRLQGCGVGCPWCDTKHTWRRDARERRPTLAAAMNAPAAWAEVPPRALVDYARDRWPAVHHAVFTGGEPLEQDIVFAVLGFISHGYAVQVETSGTAAPGELSVFESGLWMTVSPKIAMPGGKAVRADAMALADEVKHVVGKPADIAALTRLLDETPPKPGAVISLQPVSQSAKATALCVETCLARGWSLSLQTHKFVGLA